MGPDILDDYEAEQGELYELLRRLSDEQWALPTPAAGWDVRDQVSHLADTEEIAVDTVTGGPRTLSAEASRYASGEAFTEAGCDRGRALSGPEVREWWWTAAARCRDTLQAADRTARVPWGLGMGWKAFVTARLMEHWAHGLDIRAAVGAPAEDTDRLCHIAWICVNAVPYALHVAKVSAPEGHTLRVEVDGPDGGTWAYGPEDATDRITGPAGQWCRLAVQRITRAQAPDLKADGPLAELVLDHARAFL
ncbi:MAG TPA: maleylpyruvate isomerase family mycothiol-dependent enzyme [Acidimicrobiales bacterium]|nr:maleylpyruvate isomerase family mycothiol-dependent enzyme [Acidimicrobiales bacterium]